MLQRQGWETDDVLGAGCEVGDGGQGKKHSLADDEGSQIQGTKGGLEMSAHDISMSTMEVTQK